MKRYSVVSMSGCLNCTTEESEMGDLVEYSDVEQAIVKAVLKEREACAKIAEMFHEGILLPKNLCNAIADKIRGRGK